MNVKNEKLSFLDSQTYKWDCNFYFQYNKSLVGGATIRKLHKFELLVQFCFFWHPNYPQGCNPSGLNKDFVQFWLKNSGWNLENRVETRCNVFVLIFCKIIIFFLWQFFITKKLCDWTKKDLVTKTFYIYLIAFSWQHWSQNSFF